jgi:hypothetical protein
MTRATGRVIAAMLMAGLSACGTVGRGFEQEVTIATEPAGATVSLSGGLKCTSPCTLSLPRYQRQSVTARLAGCLDALGELTPSVPEAGSLWFSVIDYQLGGAYDLTPNPLAMTLNCGAAAAKRNRMIGFTDDDDAIMKAFGRSYENTPNR